MNDFVSVCMMTLQEQHIISQLQQGDKDFFWLLYDKYFQTIYEHIFYKTLNKTITEDIVADTFFKAFDKIHQFTYKTEHSFRSRLYTIANNTLLDTYKKLNPDSLDEWFDIDSGQNITKEENNRYMSEQLLDQLEKLWGWKKDIIIYRLREWLSYEEISHLTWRSQVSLRKDFSASLQELKILCSHLGCVLVIVLSFLRI